MYRHTTLDAYYSTTPHHQCHSQQQHMHSMICTENRQARVVLGDRMKYSLQLTALRLNPCRLQGVQALTMHYPWLTTNNIEIFILESILPITYDMCSTEDNLEWIWWVQEHRNVHIPVHYDQYNVWRAFEELLFWHGYDLRGVQA